MCHQMYAEAKSYVMNLLNTLMTSDVVLKLMNECASGFPMMKFCCARHTAGGTNRFNESEGNSPWTPVIRCSVKQLCQLCHAVVTN